MLPLKRIEGKYEVVRKLSEGGMGVLYLVRHRQLEELRVIKVLRSTLDSEHDLKERFLREAKVAIRLRHPNIAQLYDFSVDDDGSAFMVMEYIDGVNVEDFCKEASLLEQPMVLEVARQSLRALRFLHSKHFVHRDIAPDNLMITRDAEGHLLVKLIDLGIVKVLRDESQKSLAGVYLGKPRYSSPEQLMGKELDGRSDLYSFGITLYEMLTGSFPIPGSDFASLVTGHLYRPHVPFDETDPQGRVPAELRKVVEKALRKDPNRRWSSAAELADALIAVDLPKWNDPNGVRLAEILARAKGGEGGASEPYKGSTQTEIDRHFDQARATPRPETVGRIARSLAEQGLPSPELRSTFSISGIRAALGRGDVAEATRLLAGATDEELSLPEVREVRQEIERQMASRDGARRETREPDRDSLAWADSQVRKLVDGPPQARATAPGAPGAAGALDSARASLDEHVVHALEGGVGEAERLLRMGDTESAARVLESVHARTAVWDMPASLQVRFRALDDEARSLRLAAHLARAAHQLELGSAVEAEFELEQARKLDRNHPSVAVLAERIREVKADTHAAFRPRAAGDAPPSWLRPLAEGWRNLRAAVGGPSWLLPLLLAGVAATFALIGFLLLR
ncbi:MAG: serine/threonine protein kinase [Holophagales bacterium]|nr:serine/threonine protein kinase [Holophagales bacterium]